MSGVTIPEGRARGGLLFAQMAVSGAVMGGVRPIASYRALELGADATDIGVLAMSFAIGTLVLALPIGRLVDAAGPAKVLIAGTTISPLAVTVLVVAGAQWQLWLGCAVFGIGHLAVLVSSQTLAAMGRIGVGMDRSFGNLTAGVSIGQAVGPSLALALPALLPFTIGRTVSTTGTGLLGVVSLAGLAVAILQYRATPGLIGRTKSEHRLSAVELLRVPGIRPALLASGVVLACIDLLLAFLPLWADERGISREAVAVLLTVRAIITMISRFGVAHAVMALGRKAVLGMSVVLGALALISLPLLQFWGALVAMAALGIGLGVAQPLTMSWVATRVRSDGRGSALALRMVSNRIFQTAVPPLVGVIVPVVPSLGVEVGIASYAFILAGVLMGGSAAVVLAVGTNDVEADDGSH